MDKDAVRQRQIEYVASGNRLCQDIKKCRRLPNELIISVYVVGEGIIYVGWCFMFALGIFELRCYKRYKVVIKLVCKHCSIILRVINCAICNYQAFFRM